MEQQTQTQAQNTPEQKSSKLVKAMVIGAVAGGALAMIDSTTRKKVLDNTNQAKETISQFAADVKENPSGTKDDLMERIQDTSAVLREAVASLRNIYEKANEDILDKVTDVQDDAKEAIAATKEAGEELQEAGDKIKQAKDEMVNDSDVSAANNTQTSSSNASPQNKTQ
ncbi:hypothetical protein [Thalassobacillus devorans]|uniref:hypothetical protein n=1 Tax=Thalassobacillus devorans TaxID=279813 RepID=UPI0004B1BC53|nr:hypothetical protein [Thalassobacillus devorans]